MSNEQLAQMYALVEKAKMMEKVGKEEEALNIYLQIHEKHYPNTSFLFERPALLLEKRRRFEEAAAICEKAISLIETNHITGTKEPFQKRLDRIHEKMGIKADAAVQKKEKTSFFSKLFSDSNPNPKENKSPNNPEPVDEQSVSVQPERKSTSKDPVQKSQFLSKDQVDELLEENSSTDNSEVAATIERKVATAVPESTITQTIENQEPSKPAATSNAASPAAATPNAVADSATAQPATAQPTAMQPATAQPSAPASTASKKSRITGRGFAVIGAMILALAALGYWFTTYENDYYADLEADMSAFYQDSGVDYFKSKPFKNEGTEDPNLPVITATMVENATKLIKTNPGVQDAMIAVKGESVGFFIKVDGTVTTEGSEKLAKSYVELLAQQASITYPELLVSKSAFGGLFDHYSALTVVGGQGENIKAQGGLIKTQDKIRWQNGN